MHIIIVNWSLTQEQRQCNEETAGAGSAGHSHAKKFI